MKIALLHSRIRVEEKLLIEHFQNRGVQVDNVDVRDVTCSLEDPGHWTQYDLVFDRCLSHSQSLTIATVLKGWGIRCVNDSDVNRICGDKIEMSAVLHRNGIKQIPTHIAVSAEAALRLIEQIGYPCVLKPAVGSWGRLLAKVNDRDAAEAILEHKSTLGSVGHGLFYIQPFIEKGGSDIRTFVIGDQTICGIKRSSEHWITNTARGATAAKCEITDEINQLSVAAARAVGGGMLAIDLFQMADGRLVVNEINASMEFRNSSKPTGINIPERMVDYVIQQAQSSLSA